MDIKEEPNWKLILMMVKELALASVPIGMIIFIGYCMIQFIKALADTLGK